MFTIDVRQRGLPARREEVLALHQSINSPHLAIPGKRAGPAVAFIVGLRRARGTNAFVYLYLPEAGDCAVYVSGRPDVSLAAYPAEESEALAFVESMGFMMDSVNFEALSLEQQEELLRTLPVFQKQPPGAPAAGGGGRPRETERRSAAAQLGRLLAGF